MSDTSNLQTILSNAEKMEKEYEWLRVAESYRRAFGMVSGQDFLRSGEICERIGYVSCRAAMQSETVDQFRAGMCQAVSNYEKAKEFYGEMGESGKLPRLLRCDGMIAYMSYWLASDVSEKKKQIGECWKLAKDCLKAFEEAGDAFEYGRTFNELSISVDLGFFFEWEFQARQKMMMEALERGEKAIRFLSTAENQFELARAYMRTATCQEVFGYYFVDLSEREKHFQKAKNYLQKAEELSEEAAMIELPTVLFGSGPGGYWGDGTDAAVTNFEKALEYGKNTRDKFVIGRGLDLLAYHTSWQAVSTEDPDAMEELRKETLRYAEDAKRQYCPLSFTSPRGAAFWIEAPYPEYYWASAYWETNFSKKREFLEKAIEVSPELLKLAEDSGYPDIIGYAHMVFGQGLAYLAKLVIHSEEKQRLLEEALVHMNESIRIREQIEPLAYWNRGMAQTNRATARSDLADMVKEPETRKSMLEGAALELAASLELCIKEAVQHEKEGSMESFGLIGLVQYGQGKLLSRLYELTHDGEHLRKAIEAFGNATESFQKLSLTSRMAECHWKAAQANDDLGEYLKAAESFSAASNNYNSAGQRIPQLKNLYQEHSHYMEAWSEIERARQHHKRQEYGLAEEHFEKAAEQHKSLRHWSYLASNYSAWAQLERAEELSRKEQCEEAVQAFEQAANLLNETEGSLKRSLTKIEDQDEKQMATEMVKATHLRHEYCIGRMALEEAKILEKNGEHYSSSEKYGSAAEIFRKTAEASISEQDRKEIKFVMTLSQAWQKMTRADAEDSPDLFFEASQLFDNAKEFSPNEKARLLALGHSRFCRALEVGTRFADTRDVRLHSAMMQHLESASNYYVKAGFQNASEYTKATKLLFDAYVHTDKAQSEGDPEKKAKLFIMAEKLLQISADSFIRAEYPGKKDQVLKMLENVREQRELAVSLNEILHAPSLMSATTVFSAPVPTQENAVGLERFEQADVQANVIVRRKELKIGETLDLEIELINAGKGSALLTKIIEIIPKGFELAEKPENCRVEDNHINLKGRRLEPLKMEEVRMLLKPKIQGVFQLGPKILYLDENGKHKTHEPEPVTITVKELGIKGWLKGER